MDQWINKPTIYYDGQCPLCNFWVKWTLKRVPPHTFYFASLQGVTASKTVPSFLLKAPLNSIVLRIDNGYLQESGAIFEIIKKLPFPWKLLQFFNLFPWFITNGVYRIIAQNRFLLFPRKAHCMLLIPEYKEDFLP